MTITEAMKALIPAKYRVKTFVVPDGADTEALKPGIDPSRIRGKYNLKDKTVIGYQGGIEKWDGLQFLAEISSEIKKEIPDIKFLIAGKGSYLNKIKEILTKNGTIGDYIFLGWVQSSRIPEIMSACDLNVVPIPNHPATSPLITFRLLESMAAGVSVIVNKLPGILEIADESMVFFTNVEDAKTFADDIIKAVKTPAGARDKMKAKSRKKAETLDWRLIARKDADFVENRLPAAG
jgi:glycogen(starch) synthase